MQGLRVHSTACGVRLSGVIRRANMAPSQRIFSARETLRAMVAQPRMPNWMGRCSGVVADDMAAKHCTRECENLFLETEMTYVPLI
jgi:hypothetical protein